MNELDLVEFAENPESRCACVLLLDTSGSMSGPRIAALNEGLCTFQQNLRGDALASRRVEVAVISFNNDVQVVQDFITADQFQPPTLSAAGLTHTGSALNAALDLIEARKATYKSAGISYYRPWLLLITDGEPAGESDDVLARAIQRLGEAQQTKRVAFFAVGVAGANMGRLKDITGPQRDPVKLAGLRFNELFKWLSTSMGRVSQSKVSDTQVPLPPVGWGEI